MSSIYRHSFNLLVIVQASLYRSSILPPDHCFEDEQLQMLSCFLLYKQMSYGFVDICRVYLPGEAVQQHEGLSNMSH